VMLESLCVIVPATVGPVAPPVVVLVAVLPAPADVVPVVVGVPAAAAAAAAPARLIAAPQIAVSLVFVTNASVMISVWPAGTVNAVTAVAPAGTMRVISTRLSTTGVPVDVAGDALAKGDVMLVVVGDVVGVDVVSLPITVVVASGLVVVVWAERLLAAATATRTDRQRASTITSFMEKTPLGRNWAGQARNAGASDFVGRAGCQPIDGLC